MQRAVCRIAQGVEVKVRTDKGGGFGQDVRQVLLLTRLDKAQMAFGQLNFLAPGQRAQHGHADFVHAYAHERLMPGGGHAVQHNTGQLHIRAHHLETERGGGHGLRGTAHIQHEHDGPAHVRRDVSAGPVATGAGDRHTVEEAHGAFGEDQVCAFGIADEAVNPRQIH